MADSQHDIKALVLAAGLGTRLRPITNKIAKPALPFFGSTVLDLWLNKIAKLKIPVAVNTHHLPEQIALIANNAILKQRPLISHEPEILGTGGALRKLDGWRGQSTVFICNADVIAGIDLAALFTKHFSSNNAATLCLLRKHQQGTNPVYADDREVVGIGKIERPSAKTPTQHTYACAMLLSAKLIEHIPAGQSIDLWPAVRAAFAQNLPVGAFFFDGFWADIGTPTSYWATCKDFMLRVCDSSATKLASSVGLDTWTESLANKSRLLVLPNKSEHPNGASIYGPTFMFGQKELSPGIKLGPNAMIFGSCHIGDNATIRNSLLLPGAKIDAGEFLEDVIALGSERIAVSGIA